MQAEYTAIMAIWLLLRYDRYKLVSHMANINIDSMMLIIADLLINIRGIPASIGLDVYFDSGRYGVRGFDFTVLGLFHI